MMNTPPNNTPMEDIAEGTSVYDVSGEKVGHVSFSAMRDGFFVVEKGWLFTHQLYLPATAILANDANGLTLRLSKEELKNDQWKQPPEAAASDLMAQPPVYPNSPLPESNPAVEEDAAVLPPDGVRPLPGEPVPSPTDEAHMKPFAPDAGEQRPFSPDEGGEARLFPPKSGDLRPLPPDEASPQVDR